MLEWVSVVIPAQNEKETIAPIVHELRDHPAVKEVIVVDSASSDGTKEASQEAGARVIRLEEAGFGRAVKAGFAAARCDWVFKLDGDMRNVSKDWLTGHMQKVRPGVGLVKACWDSKEDPMPVTNLVVKPAVSMLLPKLSFIKMPISGIYLCNKALLCGQLLGNDFTFDLDLLIRIHRMGVEIEQVHLGEVLDKLKPLSNYFGMAGDLIRCVQSHAQLDTCSPVMVIMAHPDDPEIWCGGTIIKVLNAGGIVDIWIATGSQTRCVEAKRLQEIYANARIHFLNEAEFSPIVSPRTVIELGSSIETLQPQIIITHHPDDDHPDHRVCYNLVTGACMLVPRDKLPAALYLANSYFQSVGNGRFAANTFIDVSAESSMKYALIRNHQSQDVEHWAKMAQAMDALNGAKCGVLHAEAFERSSLYCCPRPSHFLPI